MSTVLPASIASDSVSFSTGEGMKERSAAALEIIYRNFGISEAASLGLEISRRRKRPIRGPRLCYAD
jgi:hypothetical protein